MTDEMNLIEDVVAFSDPPWVHISIVTEHIKTF